MNFWNRIPVLILYYALSPDGSLSSASSHSSETGGGAAAATGATISFAAIGTTTSSTATPTATTTPGGKDFGGLDFKIIIDAKMGPPMTIHLVAPTLQEKTAWISDISQVGLTLSISILAV